MEKKKAKNSHDGGVSLTEMQKLFCREYVLDLNGTAAAKRSGYSERSASDLAIQLLRKPLVQKCIKDLIDKKAKVYDVTTERIIKELSRIAFAEISVSSMRKVRRSEKVSAKTRAGLDVSYESNPTGEVIKVKRYDKVKALELLGRYKSLFNDKLDVAVTFSFEDLVMKANKSERLLNPK